MIIINQKPEKEPLPINSKYWYLLGYNGGPQPDTWIGDELDYCRLQQHRIFKHEKDAVAFHTAILEVLSS
jgi:hypothetical protein